MHLASLHLYPVKSCAGLDVASVVIEPRGPRHDRRWMVVDLAGRFITGRQLPRMVLIRAVADDDALRLEAPGMPSLKVSVPGADSARLQVQVWKDSVDAALAGAQADAWLSQFLDQPVRLVHLDARSHRPVSPARGQAGDETSFADGLPLLLISQGSLDGLNARLADALPMSRFRPNLVVADSAPHVEDDWQRIRIGGIEFEVVDTCTRCVFTTVDAASGSFDASGEPLRTLKTYRRSPAGIIFGVNMIARGYGVLRVGDAVEVIV